MPASVGGRLSRAWRSDTDQFSGSGNWTSSVIQVARDVGATDLTGNRTASYIDMNQSAGRHVSFAHGPNIGALLLCLMGVVGNLGAQVTIGPDVGIEYGLPLTVDRQAGLVNRFGAPGTGISNNLTGRAGVAVSFRNHWGSGYDPLVRLGLALSTGRFVSDSYQFREIVDSATGTEQVSTREFEVYTALSALQLDLLPLRFRWDDRLLFGAGVWGSYRLNSGFFETERILFPDSIRFDDGASERTVLSGENLGANRLRWGGILSIALRIPIGENVTLEPELFGRIDGQSLSEGIGLRRALSFGLGTSLLLDPAAHSTPSSDSLSIEAVVPPLHGPAASINLYALDSAGGVIQEATVGSVSTFYRMTMPMIPVISFDHGAVAIPDRYVRLAPAQADRFLPSALARLDPIGIYHQTLNVVGMRLREIPTARLTLTGFCASDEPSSLARARAENVRAYLSTAWGINPSRMTIVSGTSDGNIRSGYVKLGCDFRSLTDPVTIEWIVNRPTSPMIGMSRHVEGGAGVRRWAVTISRNGEDLGRYTSEDEALGRTFEGSFRLDQEATGPLVAELTVEDSSGSVAVVSDELPIRSVRATGSPASIEREVLTTVILPGGNTDSYDESIATIIGATRDCADLHISPLDCCEGDSLLRASARFREEVARSLLERLARSSVVVGGLQLDAGPSTEFPSFPEPLPFVSGAVVTIEQQVDPCR